MSLIEGSAYTILEQVEEENGCEAYRKLYLRYARTKLQNAIMRMATIVNTKFHDTNFETTFTEWESEIHKIEVSLSSKLADEIKIGILIAGTTGRIHDHLCLTLGDTLSYDDTRDTVLNYLKSRNLTVSTKHKGPDWMDVSAITKGGKGSGDGKGKGKGGGTTSYRKGKGKGKDKGHGDRNGTKGKSKGRWCHNCKSNTHDTKFCYHGNGGKGQRKGVRGLWSEWDYDEQETHTAAVPHDAAAGSTTSQQDLQSIAPPSTVAAIHYGTVVG